MCNQICPTFSVESRSKAKSSSHPVPSPTNRLQPSNIVRSEASRPSVWSLHATPLPNAFNLVTGAVYQEPVLTHGRMWKIPQTTSRGDVWNINDASGGVTELWAVLSGAWIDFLVALISASMGEPNDHRR